MSSNLNLLESKKLLRELNYLMCEIDFKNELTMEYNKQFEIAIIQFLRESPLVKEQCRNRFGSMMDEPKETSLMANKSEETSPMITKNKVIDYSSSTDVILFSGQQIDMDDDFYLEFDEVKMKKLFRDIVQNTHPDKVKSNILNSLYNKAVEANKNEDILSIYSVCDELGLDFHVRQREIYALEGRIENLKSKKDSFEQSHLWMWYINDDDENKRRKIIHHFLLNHAPLARHLF